MKKRSLLIAQFLSFALSAAAWQSCQAAHFSVWVHGIGHDTGIGNPMDSTAFDHNVTGVNPRIANWNSKGGTISSENVHIRAALDCYCTGINACYIAAHSAGDLQVGYALDHFGSTTRPIRDGHPDSAGTCRQISYQGKTTQKGWNIIWIDIGAGAGGGSELSNIGQALGIDLKGPIQRDLTTTGARALYNHNQTQGHNFNMYVGSNQGRYSLLIPGDDDGVVPYHSAGGVASPDRLCNPGAFGCSALTLGTGAAGNGRPKYAFHNVRELDINHVFDHSGVVNLVRVQLHNYAH